MKNIINNYLSQRFQKGREKALLNEGFVPITQTLPDDVFIVGFPKSGHTWMQYILSSLVFGISPADLRDSIIQEFVPDLHARKYYKRFKERAFFKSHSLPMPSYKNVIYLVRDGRDAMVSYYHMLNKVNKMSITMEQMILEDKNVFPCPWRQHVDEWGMKNPFDANILIVKYEDLLSKPLEPLKRIGEFLDIHRSEEFLLQIIKDTSIDILRDKAKRFGMVHKMLRASDGHNFFRRGESKAYESEMPVELRRAFEERASKQLRHFGYLN